MRIVVFILVSILCCQSAFAGNMRREVANLRAGRTGNASTVDKIEAVSLKKDFGILSLTPEGDAVADGLQWLQGNQNPSGSWGSAWEFADTADVIHTLRDVAPDCNEVADGLDWLAWEDAVNYEFLARQITALAGLSEYEAASDALVDELLAGRNEAEWDDTLPNWPEGGWGLETGYETDCMTTAMAACAVRDAGLAGGLAVQNVSLALGEHATYIFDVPDDANYVRVRIDELTGGPIQVRLQEGSEPPFSGIPYFSIGSSPTLIVYPDSGVPFTAGANYLRIDAYDAAATFSLTASYETPDWDTRTLAEPIAYLRESQNVDGGWGLQRGVATDLYTTLHVLLALQDYSHYGNAAEIAAGVSWLRAQQLPDGSWGYSSVGAVIETSLATIALLNDDAYPYGSDILDAISYLLTAQSGNGSWNSEPYDTSLAMLALSNSNNAPIADAGTDQTIVDNGDLVESVTLDGSGSSDIDGTIESYVWSEGGVEIATGVSPVVELILGTHTIELTVTDDGDKSDSDEVIIKVTAAPQTFYFADMDTDPNWVAEGLWQWGQPMGQGGGYGDYDPTSGYTGTNVYGYNLTGTYTDNMPETYLTTQAIDCSAYSNIELSFYRWLNVQNSPWDNATVQVTTTPLDTESWVTIYQNPTDAPGGWLHEFAWSKHTYDISGIADNQAEVYIRWCMGSTDGMYAMAGWNIDDVELVGAPGPPDSPGWPDLLADDDSGVSDTDDITAVETARVDIFVSDAKTTGIKVYNEEQLMGDAVNQGNGYWRYQFTAGQLAQGDNIITAVAVGLGGYSDSSGALIIQYKPHTLSAEFTGDGVIDLPDLVFLTSYWLQNEPSADIAPPNGDHIVNFLDFTILAETWLLTELWYPIAD